MPQPSGELCRTTQGRKAYSYRKVPLMYLSRRGEEDVVSRWGGYGSGGGRCAVGTFLGAMTRSVLTGCNAGVDSVTIIFPGGHTTLFLGACLTRLTNGPV